MKTNNIKFRIVSLLSLVLLISPITSNAVVSAGIDANAVMSVDSGPNSSTSLETDYNVLTDTTIQSSSTELEMESNLDLGLKLNTFGIAVVTASQVNSEEDLLVFSENIVVKNEGVAKVKVSSLGEKESGVAVVYKHHGKLFGFVPVTIRSKTEVAAEADTDLAVKSQISWWGFLVAKKNYNRAELESQIKNNITVQQNTKIEASAGAKARVAEAVIAEITAHAMAQVSVSS